MRKTLAQAILAAFSAILCAAVLSPGKEGRGMILPGVRDIMLVKSGYTAKSYVQAGLVAMWDAEWNAGPGMHDSNATVWKDCVAGHIATTTDTSLTWGYNYCTSPNFRFVCPVTVGQTINNSIRNRSFTIESIYCSPAATNNVMGFASSAGNSLIDRIDFNNTPNNYITTNFNNTSDTTFAANPYIANRFSSPTKFVFTPQDNGFVRLRAANAVTNIDMVNQNNVIPGVGNTITEFVLGRASRLAVKNTTMYRIAFYSRTLTDAEIAANYAIDVARFGLPTA